MGELATDDIVEVSGELRPANVQYFPSDKEEIVYNIEVEEAHCYYANGILVSNCEAGQYGDMYFERGADTQAQSKEIQQMLLAQQRMAGAYSTRN